MADHDRRKHKRVKVNKVATIRNGDAEHSGRIVDISSGGAAITLENAEDTLENDQDLELELEEIGTLFGNVVRTLDDGFAMSFELDEDSEDRLISEITGYQNGSITE